jgi:hypothetical protein
MPNEQAFTAEHVYMYTELNHHPFVQNRLRGIKAPDVLRSPAERTPWSTPTFQFMPQAYDPLQ